MLMGAVHHDMMGGCPFMPGEEAMCPMDATAHITAWQNMFATTLPDIFIILLVAVVVVSLWQDWYPPPERVPIPLYKRRTRPIIPLYQELFSNGILHGKYF